MREQNTSSPVTQENATRPKTTVFHMDRPNSPSMTPSAMNPTEKSGVCLLMKAITTLVLRYGQA